VSQNLSRPEGTRQGFTCPDYSRNDVLRILQISSHQLQGWERAGLIAARETYSFQDLVQLRMLRSLRAEDVSAASIRHSIMAMQAVSGMANPLEEATVVRTGKQIVFRHLGAMVDPVRRQLCFDFERVEVMSAAPVAAPLRRSPATRVQDKFLAAVQAEEAGEKRRAMGLYEEIIAANPEYAAAYINLGTIHFHLRQYAKAEELYRRATKVDSEYVLAFFDLGNVLDELGRFDESIEAYKHAVMLAPKYADAHYNLALAYERKGERRAALRHWQRYARLDGNGPWAEHARGQIHKLLKAEKLSIVWRANKFVARRKGKAALRLVNE
jgi:tetratricopeptide (TPR) repeat protein